MLLLTAAAGRDANIAGLIQKSTRIAVREMVWHNELDPVAFDQEVESHLPDTEAVVVDLAANEPGIALCARIHAWRIKKGAKLRLFALGAEGVEEHEDSAFQAGCDLFLGRPIQPVELLERLRKIETWQLRGAHRAPLQADVTWTHTAGSRHHGTVVDLSENGLLFDSEQPIPAGQNLALEMEIPGAPPVLSWIRVVRTMPIADSVSQYTAKIAAEFLNLSDSGRETIRAAITAVRRQEFESRLDQEYVKNTIVITDHQTELVADWLHFLFTPVAFGNPPSPCGVPEQILKQWALRLPPSEEQLFRDLVVDPSDRTSSVRWVRAWVGFRVRLFDTAMQGRLARDIEAVLTFLDQARELLTILSESLTAWDLYEKDMPDANLYHERATVLLTLREGLLLREVYEDSKEEGDPSFLDAIDRAEEFFADRDFDNEQITFERGAFREPEAKVRPKKDSKKKPPRIRRSLLVLGAIVVSVGGGLVINTIASVENRIVEDEGVLLAFPVLAEAGYSRGEGQPVFIGAVDMGQWSVMSLSERRAVAESLRSFLELDGVKSAIVSAGGAMAFQIEHGKVLVVR